MPDWLLAPCGYFSGLWRLDPKVKVLPIWFLLRTLQGLRTTLSPVSSRG